VLLYAPALYRIAKIARSGTLSNYRSRIASEAGGGTRTFTAPTRGLRRSNAHSSCLRLLQPRTASGVQAIRCIAIQPTAGFGANRKY